MTPDDPADPAEVDQLVGWHLEQLGFGPKDMARRQQQTEQAQFDRWGATGLDILGIDEDAEAARIDAQWEEAPTTSDVLDLIAQMTSPE